MLEPATTPRPTTGLRTEEDVERLFGAPDANAGISSARDMGRANLRGAGRIENDIRRCKPRGESRRVPATDGLLR